MTTQLLSSCEFCTLCYDTIPVKSATGNVSFYTSNSKMPAFELWHCCCKWAICNGSVWLHANWPTEKRTAAPAQQCQISRSTCNPRDCLGTLMGPSWFPALHQRSHPKCSCPLQSTARVPLVANVLLVMRKLNVRYGRGYGSSWHSFLHLIFRSW